MFYVLAKGRLFSFSPSAEIRFNFDSSVFRPASRSWRRSWKRSGPWEPRYGTISHGETSPLSVHETKSSWALNLSVGLRGRERMMPGSSGMSSALWNSRACGAESRLWTEGNIKREGEREERKRLPMCWQPVGYVRWCCASGHPKLSAPVIINSGGRNLVFLINIQGNPRGVQGPRHPPSSFLFLIFPNLSQPLTYSLFLSLSLSLSHTHTHAHTPSVSCNLLAFSWKKLGGTRHFFHLLLRHSKLSKTS